MAEQIHAMQADPYRLDFLRVDHPDLVAAYETNPEDKGMVGRGEKLEGTPNFMN